MSSVELRVPGNLHRQMLSDLMRPPEWAGYLLCGAAALHDREILLAREWHPVPQHHRILGTSHGLSWRPDFDVEMLNRAQRDGLSCVVVHRHGGSRPGLSGTDERTRDSLMPFLSGEAPNRPHAFVVLGDRTLGGTVHRDGHPEGGIGRMRVSGAALEDWPSQVWPSPPERHEERHDRLIRGFGRGAYGRLAASTVGVVGCGGGGSHVVQQLGYLGVGDLVLMDGDRVEETNLSRLIGTQRTRPPGFIDRILRRRHNDVGLSKVAVMERLVRRIGSGTRVTTVEESFPTRATVDALRACDVVVACVDQLQVRDDLNRFSKRYLVPLIDVGIEITPNTSPPGSIAAISGRVTKVLADGPCLRCQGVIDDAKLTRERGGQPLGYMGSARVPDPAVVTLNGIVASIAATEVLQLLTGFAEGDGPNCGWMYDGINGSVERVEKRYVGCTACLSELASGDP
jgi:molybdopterin-synthase adenylyltransferase